jgi:type I restriction enzyme, R subunit
MGAVGEGRGTEDRLDRVANDIAEHYRERWKTLEGKAMVVGYSQRICAQLVARLQKHLGQDAVTAVISATATDDPAVSAYRRTRQQREDLEKFFKKPDSPLKVVVVRDMWLTGFDAPALHTLYIDKPMKDHGLLQAIARVNRVFGDKPGGLVVATSASAKTSAPPCRRTPARTSTTWPCRSR